MLVYAIDFGTSNSLLAAGSHDQIYAPIALDPDSPDPSILRSILYFPSMKECFYGTRAIKEFTNRDMEGRLIRSVKKFLPMRSFIGTWIENRPMNLEDLIALFLKELRSRANQHFNQDVDHLVMGRPARFSPNDEDDAFAQGRLERAARLAGFKHIEFCPEPVAAAREFRAQMKKQQIVLVADYGGGTSDYTIIKMSQEDYQDSDVLAIGGVAVAGDALDGAVMRKRIAPHFGADVSYQVPFGSNVLKMPVHLMEKICSPAEISVLRKRDTLEFFNNVKKWSIGGDDRLKMDRLFSLIHDQLGFSIFEEIERLKRRLSDNAVGEFNLVYPGIDLHESVKREDFDLYISDTVDKMMTSLDDTVKKAQINYSDIDLICCTGGTAKVPAIREKLAERFGKEKIRQHNHFHSVVQGLSERAKDLAKS